MDNCDELEWIEFNELANSYLQEDSEAKKRTGISRYYYGTFCTARDFINENELYLNDNSKEKMTSKKADVHNETSKIFRNHEDLNRNAIGKFISKDLNKLRRMRNKADYDKVSSNLDEMLQKSKIKSERILELLNNLN